MLIESSIDVEESSEEQVPRLPLSPGCPVGRYKIDKIRTEEKEVYLKFERHLDLSGALPTLRLCAVDLP